MNPGSTRIIGRYRVTTKEINKSNYMDADHATLSVPQSLRMDKHKDHHDPNNGPRSTQRTMTMDHSERYARTLIMHLVICGQSS